MTSNSQIFIIFYILILAEVPQKIVIEMKTIGIPKDDLPFLSSEIYWEKNSTKVNCKDCFPTKIDSEFPCLPRCQFSSNGASPDVIKSTFKDKVPLAKNEKPYFIISYGPAGSGKSFVIDALKKLSNDDFKTLNKENTIEVNVDKIFQEGPLGENFKNHMSKIKNKSQVKLFSQRFYQFYRWIADQISDLILNTALASRFNIIWETTGASVEWTKREIKRIKFYDYKTLIAFPLATNKQLINRVVSREKETGQEGTPIDELKQNIEKSHVNLINLLKGKCDEWIEKDVLYSKYDCKPQRSIVYSSGENFNYKILFDDGNNKNLNNESELEKILSEARAE